MPQDEKLVPFCQ